MKAILIDVSFIVLMILRVNTLNSALRIGSASALTDFLPFGYTGDDFSEEIWVSYDDDGGDGFSLLAHEMVYEIEVDVSKNVFLKCWQKSLLSSKTSAVSPLPTSPVHLTLTYARSSQNLQLYYNGSLEAIVPSCDLNVSKLIFYMISDLQWIQKTS